jgi:hypothetical protein
MTRYLIAATLAGILAAGCASAPPAHYMVVPIKSNGTDLPGLDAKTTLESRQPGGIVSARGDDRFADFGAGFIIAVQNKSAAPAEFGPKNVVASINGKSIPILAAAELDEKVKARLAGYVRATNRTGTTDIDLATASAQREYRYETFGGNLAGQGGGSSCALSSTDNCRNYRLDRENREADARVIAETAAVLQQSQQLIAQRALQPATVGPEAIAGGAIVIQPPKGGGTVDLTITFNGQTHRFSFNATPTA